MKTNGWIFLMAAGLLCLPVDAQDETGGAPMRRRGGGGAVDMTELRARRMMENALDLLKTGQIERGVAMLEAVNTMFPESDTRFQSALELARHFQERKEYDQALPHLQVARQSEDAEQQAEAWFRLGAIAFHQGDYNAAFANLRRVTNEFPASPYANHAYDYIGQGHFKQGRWGKAVEAFRMVGTAVPDELVLEDEVLAEAGQRLFVKVKDKDLRILQILGGDISVKMEAQSGDVETTGLEQLGRGGEDWIASMRMAPEPGAPEDGVLTVQGGEWITVTYVDGNTAEGEVDVVKTTRVRIVSTGAVSVTDGAYHRSVKGVFAGQPAFVRLTDLDLDVSNEPDTAEVTVTSMYLEQREAPEEGAIAGIDVTELEEAEEVWLERETMRLTLVETGPHTGEFRGSFRPALPEAAGNVERGIAVRPNDEVVVTYMDDKHLRGSSPQERVARVKVVVGGSTEPQSIVSVANDADTQARKLLIEAQLLHRWGSIFKEVGLEDSASMKAEEGLEKVDEIMKITARQSITREILEQAFAVKWDLLLVQGRLNEAIETCLALVRIFPDTDLVDRAFMNIARARAESEEPEEKQEALKVYQRVIDLPESDYKAEAQYRRGEVTEEIIKIRTKAGQQPDFAPAMVEYRKCAEAYPNSPFAGESFNKIITYHIGLRDYVRSVELMDRVVQDYPDAPWLDEVLLKWGVVAFRMRNPALARQKFMQVLEEYPNGPAAAQATSFLQRLQ